MRGLLSQSVSQSLCVYEGGVEEIHTFKKKEKRKKKKKGGGVLPLQPEMREHNYRRLPKLAASSPITPRPRRRAVKLPRWRNPAPRLPFPLPPKTHPVKNVRPLDRICNASAKSQCIMQQSKKSKGHRRNTAASDVKCFAGLYCRLFHVLNYRLFLGGLVLL